MTALTWVFRLIIIACLLVFAVLNTDPVNLNLVFGQSWQAPLVIVLLAFFAGGMLLGVLSLLGLIFRQRLEIARLKRAAGQVPVALPQELPPAP